MAVQIATLPAVARNDPKELRHSLVCGNDTLGVPNSPSSDFNYTKTDYTHLIVAIHQPQYLPWLGYFDKMRRVDIFCYLNDVQYKKNEWQNRNRIKTAQGWQWLTVPVRYHFPEKINEVTINDTIGWQKKHLQALITNYSRAPFYKDHITIFEDALSRDWAFISELNIYLLERLREALNIDSQPTVVSSNLDLSDEPSERLIDICQAVGADTYLSGPDGAKYMDLERFEQKGIKVVTQEFKHPVYPQLFEDFESHMSIVDLLFNCGPESMQVIERANEGLS